MTPQYLRRTKQPRQSRDTWLASGCLVLLLTLLGLGAAGTYMGVQILHAVGALLTALVNSL